MCWTGSCAQMEMQVEMQMQCKCSRCQQETRQRKLILVFSSTRILHLIDLRACSHPSCFLFLYQANFRITIPSIALKSKENHPSPVGKLAPSATAAIHTTHPLSRSLHLVTLAPRLSPWPCFWDGCGLGSDVQLCLLHFLSNTTVMFWTLESCFSRLLLPFCMLSPQRLTYLSVCMAE